MPNGDSVLHDSDKIQEEKEFFSQVDKCGVPVKVLHQSHVSGKALCYNWYSTLKVTPPGYFNWYQPDSPMYLRICRFHKLLSRETWVHYFFVFWYFHYSVSEIHLKYSISRTLTFVGWYQLVWSLTKAYYVNTSLHLQWWYSLLVVEYSRSNKVQSNTVHSNTVIQ